MSKEADKVVIDSKIADKERLAKCLIWDICPECGGHLILLRRGSDNIVKCTTCKYAISVNTRASVINNYKEYNVITY